MVNKVKGISDRNEGKIAVIEGPFEKGIVNCLVFAMQSVYLIDNEKVKGC